MSLRCGKHTKTCAGPPVTQVGYRGGIPVPVLCTPGFRGAPPSASRTSPALSTKQAHRQNTISDGTSSSKIGWRRGAATPEHTTTEAYYKGRHSRIHQNRMRLRASCCAARHWCSRNNFFLQKCPACPKKPTRKRHFYRSTPIAPFLH